jgi:hypothetical protein
MNYIELINWFWQCDEVWEFTAIETRLYLYLLKVANALSWQQNPFWHSDIKTSVGARCSINSLKTARNRLVQAELIKVTPGGKGYGDKTRYQILTPKAEPKVQPKVIPNSQPKVEPLTKLNQTKDIPPIPPKGNDEDEKVKGTILTLPFNSKRFESLWGQLVNMPKWKKKPLTSLSLALKRLGAYDEPFACELISRAIEGNYQGVVFSNTDEEYAKRQKKSNGQILQPKDEVRRKEILEKFDNGN